MTTSVNGAGRALVEADHKDKWLFHCSIRLIENDHQSRLHLTPGAHASSNKGMPGWAPGALFRNNAVTRQC